MRAGRTRTASTIRSGVARIQVASGRFGVTSDYLTNASDLQIKMAQGAKPGEGGQLPGQKVYPWIAKTRHSTPGVGLISPPRTTTSTRSRIQAADPRSEVLQPIRTGAREAGRRGRCRYGRRRSRQGQGGCGADLWSRWRYGCGSAYLSTLVARGSLGLAETQQTLLLNGLRDRIVVQVDGQLKTGRDVIMGALPGLRSSASRPLRWWSVAAS